MKHFRIRNHEKFQHYKNRNPPWIMVHLRLFGSQRFLALSDGAKWQAIALALIASRYDNHLPDNPKWLREETHSASPINLEALFEAKFIVWCRCAECASNLQQDAGTLQQDACSEESIGEERRAETDARAQGAPWSIDRFKLPANMNGRCRAKLQEWLDDRKLHRRPAYKTSRWVARAWKNAGEDEGQLIAAVDHSMAQEYTGIYAPGKTPAKSADPETWTDDLGRLCKRDPFGHLVVVRDE